MGRRHLASRVLILAATLSWSAMFILQVIIYLWHVSFSKYIGWIIFKLTILNVQVEASVNEESLYFVFHLCQMAPKIWVSSSTRRINVTGKRRPKCFTRNRGLQCGSKQVGNSSSNEPTTRQLSCSFSERKFHCSQEYGNNVECFI